MGDHNSPIAFYTQLSIALHADVASTVGQSYDNLDFERDQRELNHRIRTEGMSFLTKTLPSYGKAVDSALSRDTELNIPGLKKRPDTSIPWFLGSLFSLVFDSQGRERSDACPNALRSLRQFLYAFYKLELPYDPKLCANIVKGFKETDKEIGRRPILSSVHNAWLQMARKFTSRMFCNFDYRDINPRHGPGAVATGERAWDKRNFKRWYRNIAVVYPYEEFFSYNLSHLCDELDRYVGLEELDTGTAKVVLVPKDSRGPRLISCEPLEYQWIQQGLGRAMMAFLESHEWSRGQVNFTDQGINRALAMEGSSTGKWVTLDMKDASDRVSMWLVDELFGGCALMDALYATRSGYTTLPDGERVLLEKFAPMGSALCFPVESYVFWVLAVCALVHEKKMSWLEARTSVFVYGDDIICRVEDHDTVRRYLELVKLKFNEQKCCTGRSFRESCGCDAFRGVDVTPTKFRTVWCPRGNPESILSYCSYQNDMHVRGYWATAEFLRAQLKGVAKIPDKDGLHQTYLGTLSHQVKHGEELQGFRTRFSKRFHRYEVLTLAVRTSSKEVSGLSWNEILRIHSQGFSQFTWAGLYPVRGRLNLKPRWCPVAV